MPMTPEAKRLLSTTIRTLRKRLLEDLQAAAESAWRLSIKPKDAELVRDPAAHKARFLAWAKDEAGLPEAAAQQRYRLEAWIAEQARAVKGKDPAATRERFRLEVEKQAAYTLLNRLIFLRLLEAAKLRTPEVVTGGWESRGYKQFREVAPALCSTTAGADESEGYAFLLRLVFDDLAHELHGLYGPAGIADLIPIPSATLRAVVEELDNRGLETCWTDDMTLGWVYQYWNDPERERLDDKLKEGGKVEPHEIASKTQMFTERYMVEWLLQNSLGPMWLAMCKKHGWTARAEADGTLQRLEERRIDWRAKRDRGEVSLTELMPLHTDLERRWAYYVPQPVPADAVEKAPKSLKDLKLIDPACGSGHFLVVALELLVPLFQEEAEHSGKAADPAWSLQAIVEHIFGETLHGVDLDPRAVQIATAALWLKARQLCPAVEPKTLHVVASSLRLAALPANDPALEELREAIQKETGIPGKLTDTLLQALRGADHLGSLLKIDAAVDEAVLEHERTVGLFRTERLQGDLFKGYKPQQVRIDFQTARQSVEEELEAFLERHTSADDLGLRLRGEQLAAGVRFVRMMKEGSYDLVVGNPPYQGTSKMVDASYVAKRYPRGKADLYAAFLERGLELAREGGVSAQLTMRNWMFIKQYAELREWLLKTYDLRALGDFAVGAFDEVANDVLSVVSSVFHAAPPRPESGMAAQPTPLDDRSYDRERTKRKRAATLCQRWMGAFSAIEFFKVPLVPLLYWWRQEFFNKYASTEKLGESFKIRAGLTTGDNPRFTRAIWEVPLGHVSLSTPLESNCDWVPYIKGSEGREWFDCVDTVLAWKTGALEKQVIYESKGNNGGGNGTPSRENYFKLGVAVSPVGMLFSARAHRITGVFSNMGSSVFPTDIPATLCALNSSVSRRILSDLNPGIHFEAGDVNRLPLFPIQLSKEIFATVDGAYTEHESHREPSVEFKQPGPSPWCYAQEWAQRAVDRPAGDPLPDYEAVYDLEPATDHLSFALGVALGRFGADGQGILDPAKDDLEHALPAGILFLDGTLEVGDVRDSIGHTAATLLRTTWDSYGRDIDPGSDLRTWLRTSFFPDVHRQMYENRPIHWPLSSEKRTFVAWVNIHRFTPDTLRILLAEHLYPTAARLEGELADLTTARYGEDKKAARAAERRYAVVQKAREELRTFIAAVEQCSELGPPPVEGAQGKAGCPPREANARYAPDLDDGVMINSAALWPLLEPQWKDPAKWWKELASAQGRKDYDWSHLAMRYWPTRVDAKCQADPSLGVAHGCFWRYHPARAWAWELRLQDEIGVPSGASADFRIVEAPYRGDEGDGPYRATYLRDHPEDALAAVEKEVLRRRRKQKRPIETLELLESGLWSALPDQVWAMEMRVIEKQQHDFRLRSPDEPAARATWEGGHPLHVIERREIVLNLPAEVVMEEALDGEEPSVEGSEDTDCPDAEA